LAFIATSIVNLTYAKYQGVSTLDSVNNESITQFLGIRYAAAPTGKVFFPYFVSFIPLQKTGPLRFREPQLPPYMPGVQLANKQPSDCIQAGEGTAPKTPFRNAVPNTSPAGTRRLETLSDRLTELEGSEDCLFLK
jgi:carboxylesterase type B